MLQSFAKNTWQTLYIGIVHCHHRSVRFSNMDLRSWPLHYAQLFQYCWSQFLRDILSACLFLDFLFLRLFAGGYHAPTYAQCFILTNSVYLVVYLVSRVFIAFQSTIPAIVLTLYPGLIIFYLSPIRNKNILFLKWYIGRTEISQEF